MELRAEVERGFIDPLLRHRRVQIQVIAGGAATETAIHLAPQMDGERSARRPLRAMDRAGATQRWSRGRLRLEADQGQDGSHGGLLTHGPEIDAWHTTLPLPPRAEQGRGTRTPSELPQQGRPSLM